VCVSGPGGDPDLTQKTGRFTGANLAGINFNRVNVSSFNFAGANLTGANLAGQYLPGTNFTGANLTGANLTGAVGLHSATWYDTTCPDGQNSLFYYLCGY
jgi:uncharacterized protein YjbI with pentapeptide repeats